MKIKSRFVIILAVFAIVATAVSVLSLSAFAVREDYSNPNATDRVTLNSADILERALGIELSTEEGEYLALFGGESISYGERVPTSYVMTEYFAERDELLVIAKVYEYETTNGFVMRWTPVRAVLGNVAQEITEMDGGYSVSFTQAGEQSVEQVRVEYEATVTVSRKTINSIINLAYSDAALWREYADSLAAQEKYSEDMLAYEEYLAERTLYAENYAAYIKYLAELAEYESALKTYEEYESALAKYNDEYAAYIKYLDDMAEYDKKLAAYEEYLKNIETVAYQLSLIDGTKNMSTSLQRAVYNAIVGDTVTQVIENKDVIANDLTGIDGSVIDLAGTSTENLRALFADYFALTDEADKYLYYALNYENFRDSFTNLLKTLDYLYDNGKVRVALGERDGMKEKYEILLAQLYYVVTALNDTPVSKYNGSGRFDSSYKILGKTPLSILGEPYMPDEDNAKPLSCGYPITVEMPNEIAKVEKPVKPTPVQSPVPPKTVNDPGEPPLEVTRPTPPTIVSSPYPLENHDELPREVEGLLAAYSAGLLERREEISENKQIPLMITAEKKFLNIDEILIKFYDENGTLLDIVNAERFSYVEFSGTSPTKHEDEYGTYYFAGWRDAGGREVDMSCVDCDGYELELYPIFECDYKLYRVKWIIDGKEIITYARLGETPVFDGVPYREDDGGCYYEFSGWNKELHPVSANESDNVYHANFSAKFILPFSNGSGASIAIDGDTLVADCTLSLQKRFDVSRLISSAARNYGIRLVAKSYTLEISYSEVIKMQAAGVAEISVTTSQRGTGGYGFTVSLYDREGRAVGEQIYATVTLPFRFSDPANMRLYCDTGEGKELIRVTPDEKSLTVNALCGAPHYAVTEYSIDIIKNDSTCYVSIDKSTASAGERVKIYCHESTGYDVVSVFLIGVDGTETPLERGEVENYYEFIMPAQSVSVGVNCRLMEYTVKFVSDGKVLSAATYKHGEFPVAPNAPQKMSDGSYRYEFAGWNSAVSRVDSDKVYLALYKAIPLPVKEKPSGLIISDSVKYLIMRVVTYGVYVGVIFVPAVTVTGVMLVRKKKQYPRMRVTKTPKT